jgi:hypothetical protein
MGVEAQVMLDVLGCVARGVCGRHVRSARWIQN